MSFPGSCARACALPTAPRKARTRPRGPAWPFGPFCAMFGVSKISIRSRCICAGFVGGQTPPGPAPAPRGAGRAPRSPAPARGEAGRALRSRAPAPQPPARARGASPCPPCRREKREEGGGAWRRNAKALSASDPAFRGFDGGSRARRTRYHARGKTTPRRARLVRVTGRAGRRRLPHAPDREKIRARRGTRKNEARIWCRRTAAYGHPRRHAARSSAHRSDVRHVR